MTLSANYNPKEWEGRIYSKWISAGIGSPENQPRTSKLPQILFATTNNSKIRVFRIAWEYQQLDKQFELLTLKDLPKELLESLPEVEENAGTFAGDALLKAEAYAKHTGLPTISQDRGFIFTALNWPGTLTKQEVFGDDKKTFNTWYDELQVHVERCRGLLSKIEGIDRSIEVVQGMAIALPDGTSFAQERINYGRAANSIDDKVIMIGGGYDWFFVPANLDHVLSGFGSEHILDDYCAKNLYPITSGIVDFLNQKVATRRQKYSIVVPPPNLTGVLHVGHALEHTIMDTISRIQRQKDVATLYYPGVDHAGIQLEGVISKLINKGEFDTKLKEL